MSAPRVKGPQASERHGGRMRSRVFSAGEMQDVGAQVDEFLVHIQGRGCTVAYVSYREVLGPPVGGAVPCRRYALVLYREPATEA